MGYHGPISFNGGFRPHPQDIVVVTRNPASRWPSTDGDARSRTGSTARLTSARRERTGDVFNPATGEVQAKVAFATPAVVDEAVESAARASQTWRTTSIAKRTKILFAFRELVDKHQHEIAELLTLEHGKVTADALGEVQRGLEVIEFACGIADLAKGEFCENVSTEVDTYSIRQPLGVVAGITPFNFPAMVPMWMYPIAIACGNTFVLKPSERDPSAAIFCAQLFAEAGLPPRRVQRRARRQGRGRSPARASEGRGDLVRRLDADRAVHLRDRHASTASACRRSAARRTT